MRGCDAELCENWTGFGCVCEALDLDKPLSVDSVCADCGCSLDDHNDDRYGGDCTACGDCGGWR